MDLTDIIYSNDYINILIQNYVAQSERYQMLFPESSALLTLNSQYSVLFLERSLLPGNLFGEILFTGLPKLFHAAFHPLFRSLRHCTDAESLRRRVYRQKCNPGFSGHRHRLPPPRLSAQHGQSRILSIWDQTDRTGTPPPQFPYGSLYEKVRP